MARRIFIGNLFYGTNDDGLRAAFAGFGTVKDAKVIMDRETGRSRGFGFVEFTADSEAEAAITAMNGQDLDGRQVVVNVAEERTRGGGGNRGGGGGGGYSPPPQDSGGGRKGGRGERRRRDDD